MSFVIRIRCSSWVTLDDGQLRHLASITRYWKRGLTRTFYNVTLYRSLRLNLVVHRFTEKHNAMQSGASVRTA